MANQESVQSGKIRLRSPRWMSAVFVLGIFLLAALIPAQGQSYPTKPITIVVGFPPGGPTDVAARVVSTALSNSVKQPVIVDNRPGAGGNVAAGIVARADKDGYTLLLTQISTHGISPSLYKKLSYNAKEDFLPVTQLINVPVMLTVTQSMPVHNVKELIHYLKQHPDEVNFASGGSGTSMHLSGELFKYMTGTRMTHIVYKGSSTAYPDLISGRVQVMFDPMTSIFPLVQSGRIRGLAVGSKTRVPTAPEFPTIDESGVPGFEVNSWFGIAAPKGTPSDIITFLYQEFAKILRQEGVRKQLAGIGAICVGSSPSEFAKFIDIEIEKWRRVVDSAGLKVD